MALNLNELSKIKLFLNEWGCHTRKRYIQEFKSNSCSSTISDAENLKIPGYK